jgi:uncharacterized membrane protein
MSAPVTGAIAGLVLAVVALTFGFWGFLLAAVLTAVGALIGAIVGGRIDTRALADVLRGRRSA